MEKNLTGSTTNIISIPEAIQRTTNWREFMTANTKEGVDPRFIPKAVYISRTDILEMAERLNDPTMVGARAYFTLDNPEEELDRNIITFCLVMVRSCKGKLCGEDVLSLAGSSNGLKEGDDDGSGIYDFTQPCPDYCDTGSPLYNGRP